MGAAAAASAWAAVIGEAVGLGIEIAKAVRDEVDEDRWADLGPEIEGLIERIVAGEEISDEELRKYIPEHLQMRALQLRKKRERIEQGLPV